MYSESLAVIASSIMRKCRSIFFAERHRSFLLRHSAARLAGGLVVVVSPVPEYCQFFPRANTAALFGHSPATVVELLPVRLVCTVIQE